MGITQPTVNFFYPKIRISLGWKSAYLFCHKDKIMFVRTTSIQSGNQPILALILATKSITCSLYIPLYFIPIAVYRC